MRLLALVAAAFCPILAHPATVLHCGRLVDVGTLQVHAERTIVVDGKRIQRIEQGYANVPDAIDLKQHTCLPGPSCGARSSRGTTSTGSWTPGARTPSSRSRSTSTARSGRTTDGWSIYGESMVFGN